MRSLIQIGSYCYRMQDKIGEGSSSTVYKGYLQGSLTRFSSHHQCFAIKQMNNQNNLVDIEQELKILINLRQEQGVIKLLDTIFQNKKIYIVTQFCEGGTLKNIIKTKGPLSEEKAIELFKQIVKSYESLYKKTIIHRDIKPANILLKNNKIKIADFGFAAYQEQLSSEKYRVGSPLYMPYQTLKENTYSYKGDIWALGITLYEMLIGVTPFKGAKLEDLYSQMLNFNVRTKVSSFLSDFTLNLLQKLLKIDPNERISFFALKNLLFTTAWQRKVYSPVKQRTYFNKSQEKSSPILKHRNQQSLLKNPQQSPLKKSLKAKSKFKITTQQFNKISQKEMEQKKQKIPVLDNQQLFQKLLSQIHLVRFMFKIWQLLNKNKQLSSNWLLKNYLIGLIFGKLEQTENLTLLSQSQAKSFRSSSKFLKLIEYCSQYRAKYSLIMDKKISQNPSITKLLKCLPSQLLKIYSKIKELDYSCIIKSKLIVTLDFILTLYQLLNLLHNSGFQKFHLTSKISTIASLSTQNILDVKDEQFQQIKEKMIKLKLL